MRYNPIPASVYKNNRIQFSKALKTKSLAVFNSNDIYPISADSTVPFEQHRDLFYLSGINQEETVLLLFKKSNQEFKEILFLTKPNDLLTHWEGARLDRKKTLSISGIHNIHWLNELDNIIGALMKEVKILYLNKNEHYRAKVETQTREERFNNWITKEYPSKETKGCNIILQGLRSIKEPIEIQLIQKA